MTRLIAFANLWYFVVFVMAGHYLYLGLDHFLPETPQNYLLAGMVGFVTLTFSAHLVIRHAPRV